MKKIFLDSDVILDLLTEREPFHYSPTIIFEKAERNEVTLFASSVCFTNLFYVLRKSYTSNQVYNMLNKLIVYVNILNVDAGIIQLGLASGFRDFEDAVQYYTAKENQMEVILTRNTNDYKLRDIPIMTADEFLSLK